MDCEAESSTVTVTVIYATEGTCEERRVTLARGATLAGAISASKIAEDLGLELARLRCGVFGHLRSATDVVADGDRVEIYRPLTVDPNEARLRRALRKARKASS